MNWDAESRERRQRFGRRLPTERNGIASDPNPSGLCMCGCGETTPVATQTHFKRGLVSGRHIRYAAGHYNGSEERRRFLREDQKHVRREQHPRWKGGVYVAGGYRHVTQHQGPNRREHRLVVERAMGKPLPKGAVVHHVNGDKSDNRPQNLVVCQDDAYHNLLHLRQRALDACGHASWRKCPICKQWDALDNLRIAPSGGSARHLACVRSAWRKREVAA